MKKTYSLCLSIACLLCALTSVAQTEVTLYTTMGNIVVKLEDSRTPITAGNFITLTQAKYYDGVIFHRVINNFMIQGGDPTGTGSGGPGYAIQDEFDSNLSNLQKTISMANSGPNTGGSQFFINLVNNTHLDYNKPPFTSQHAVFGIVTSGFTVVQDIGKVPVTSGSNRPVTDVVMDSVRVTKAGPFITGLPKIDYVNVQIFPNPVSSETSVTIISSAGKLVNVSVYDQMGRQLYDAPRHLSAGMNTITAEEIRQMELKPGLYYLLISDEYSVTQQKFVKLR
jgi:cyclophilin family peptidyl-prolyl cis-trans isomerase